MKSSPLRYFLCLSFLFSAASAYGAEVLIAVAANFAAPMEKLLTEFKKESAHQVRASYGSTGAFFAQIKNGAPFEILLAADQEQGAPLEAAGLAAKDERFIYATGKLVLWSPQEKFVDARGEILNKALFRHVALANPELAPYGKAAEQVLQALALQEKLKAKKVFGENITQAFQFVSSGNAELGFVASSQVLGRGGSQWLISQELYAPLHQEAVLLKKGQGKAAPQQFLKFLKSPKATAILKEYGYAVEKFDK